jgi:RNase H-like domain found in reverse transcriptase
MDHVRRYPTTTQEGAGMLIIAPPKNKSELWSFIGMVNYYRDAWIQRSDVLAPLAKLCGKNSKWEWTPVHQHAFDTMKKILARDVLLANPDFSKKVEIFTDASDKQLGAIITQEGRPIKLHYNRKRNTCHSRNSQRVPIKTPWSGGYCCIH